MPNPVAANDLQPISGSLQTSRISYAVDTAGKNYGQDYNGTTWYSDIPQNGSQYTIISDNYTANYYVSRSNAGGGYVEGGLPGVDEYSAPVFWMTAGTSSLDIITIVNGLPDRIGQTPFSSGSQALNWIASSSNYFAVGPPYEQINTNKLGLYLDASQVISYPTTASTWYDISGYNYKATLINGPTFNSSYGSITFDGIDDYVNCGDIRFGTSPFTFEVWFNMNSAAAGYKWVMGKQGFNMGITINGTTLYFFLYDSSNNLYAPGDSISANKWYQATGVYDGSSIILYKNGVNVASQAFTNTPRNYDTLPLYLGTPDAGSLFFPGQIAKSRFYSKALTQTDITQNYYGGPIVTGSISGSYYANNLVSYASGSTATYNLSANIISGSLQNGVAFSPLNGGYWSFDGSDDRILLEGSTTSAWNLPTSIDWTVSAWIRTTTTANGLGAGSIFSNSSGGPVYSMMGINAGVITYWYYYSSWVKSNGTIPVNDGKWHMLTWVNFAGGTMDLYVDGGIDTAGVGSNTASGNALDIIGASWAAYYQGDIASLQINKGKAFTAAEVLQQYNATK